MRVTNVRKIRPQLSADITTATENFYARVGDKWALLHNSPAVFAGIDPADGKFFVAKKSVFSSKGEVYKKPSDIDDAGLKGDLNDKMKQALRYIPSLGIKSGVVQGDFLYAKKDLKTMNIDGEPHITFHPNTIVYAVPAKSDLAKKILASEIGIVWHTKYTGSSLPDMSATFGVGLVTHMKDSKSVWSTDAEYRDVSGMVMFTAAETNQITKILSNAGKLFRRLDKKTINGITNSGELLRLTKTYINSHIRRGERIKQTMGFVSGLVKYIEEHYQKKIDSFKTEKRKNKEHETAKNTLKYFKRINKKQIAMLFEIYNYIIDAKHMIISKLDQARDIGTFIMTKAGLQATGHEGFVAIDHTGKNAVKLVDRLQFSWANFSPDIKKGWE